MEEVRWEEEKARDARRGSLDARAGKGVYAHRRLSLRPVRSHVGFMMKYTRFAGGDGRNWWYVDLI